MSMNLSSSFKMAVKDTTGMVTRPSGTVASRADTIVPSSTLTYCDDIICGMVSDWLLRIHCRNVAISVNSPPATGDVNSDTASSEHTCWKQIGYLFAQIRRFRLSWSDFWPFWKKGNV